MEIKIIDTRTVPTVQIDMDSKSIVMHSKYNPTREAEDWVRNALKLVDPDQPIIIIGLAAGYHQYWM